MERKLPEIAMAFAHPVPIVAALLPQLRFAGVAQRGALT